MGYQCVESLLDVVEGEKLDDFIDTGCKVITPDNAQEYLDREDEYKISFFFSESWLAVQININGWTYRFQDEDDF